VYRCTTFGNTALLPQLKLHKQFAAGESGIPSNSRSSLAAPFLADAKCPAPGWTAQGKNPCNVGCRFGDLTEFANE
ncbi:MAG: hypothetical protein KBH75_08600, partial [Saprospiraceae bacterium]|nr:hypothetical protein [Saprospiraceae bacterium]